MTLLARRHPPRSSRLRVLVCCLLAAGCLSVGCRSATKPAPPPRTASAPSIDWQDVTSSANIDFTYRNGREAGRYTILESLGGGVAMFDYDGDRLLDLLFTGGGSFTTDSELKGHPPGLFRNHGAMQFADVSEAARLPAARNYSHGVATSDFDNDGFEDVLITGYGGVTTLAEPRGRNLLGCAPNQSIGDHRVGHQLRVG